MFKSLPTDDKATIGQLPPRSRAKRHKVGDDFGTLSANQREISDRVNDLFSALQDVDRQERLLRDRAPGNRLTEQAVDEFDRKRASIKSEIDRLKQRRSETQRIWQIAGELDANITDWMRSVSHLTLREVAVSIPRGATEKSIRSDISAADDEILAANQSARDRVSLIAEMEKAVDAKAAEGAPSIDPRIWQGDPTKFQHNLEHISSQFFTWLMADEIKTKLAGLLPADGPNTLTDQQREKKLAALARRRLELERIEEALIEKAEAEGRYIARRPDASPEAILGVEVVER